MNKFFVNSGPFLLDEITKEFGLEAYLNAKPLSDFGGIFIENVDELDNAGSKDVTFFTNSRYLDQFKRTNAKACITSEKYIKQAPRDLIVLVSPNPYSTFAKIAAKFYNTIPKPEKEISAQAFVSESASVGSGTEIMANAYIDDYAKIGANVKIYPNVYIGKNVEIGNNCVIHHAVTIQHAVVGNGTIIHPGTRIGQDGFGFAYEDGKYLKVPQIGHVIIGNNVEIGANCTIDRGTIKNTVVGDMCQLDNLVQLGHNVELGMGCVVVSHVGISGSTKVGKFVQMGGQVGVAGHLKIGDGAQIAAQSGVMRDIGPGQTVIGSPAMPMKEFFRQIAMLKKLVNKKEKND